MEKWLMEMGYFPLIGDLNDLLAQFRSNSTPRTDKVWKHIVAHVRPINEVEMIKKQCLLHKLENSSPRYFNIEDQLKSMKDFKAYLRKKEDQSRLNDIKQQVEKKKIAIREQLNKMEQLRKNSLLEEEALKESVYKLNHLKKKKKTVERIVQKLDNDTQFMMRLKSNPKHFVTYGSKPSDWQRKVLVYVSELPPELEFETIFSRMEELVKSSQFPALPSWDRTETLTEMENALSSKLNLMNNMKLKSDEISKELKSLVNSLVQVLEEGNVLDVNKVKLMFDEFQERILKEALEVGRALSVSKIPYVLESERHTIRRFMNLIDGKVRDINKLLPVDVGDFCSSDLPDAPTDLSLPARPPTKKLVDSVSREIECFMQLNLRQKLPDHIINYVKPCVSGYHQLLQLKNEMMLHTKLMNLDQKIHGLQLTDCGARDYVHLPDTFNELNSTVSENMILVKNEIEMLDEVYERVKAGVNFLRKEPLNESLTGVQINGKDINYWLKKYLFAKKEHDHELWLLNNM